MSATVSPVAVQIRELLSEADADTVPGGILAWLGRTDFPDGVTDVPALRQDQWEETYFLLENAALERRIVQPQSAVTALTRDLRPDGELPIAIASFRLAVPRPELVEQVRAAATAGTGIPDPPPDLPSAIEERHAFIASGLLSDQWGSPVPAYRRRHVQFVLDEAFYFTNPGEPLPDKIEVDLGDGHGLRKAAFGEAFGADYPDGGTAAVTIRCHYGDASRAARFELAISDREAPPAPDETWQLAAPATVGRPGNTGRAYVYRAPNRTEIRHPLILVEGFPGGWPYHYLYELLNAVGTLDKLLAAGYDVILVGLDSGADLVQRNADVLIECIRKANKRTSEPLVVGGLSLGGLVSRYALAALELRGEAHNARAYVSIDAPHGGAYTSLGVQWFVKSFLPFFPALGDFEALLDSPGNQQMMLFWLHDDGTPEVSPLREQLLRDFERVGRFPKQPRKLAVSCGRGDGKSKVPAGAPTLTWDGHPFISATLRTLSEAEGVVADGTYFLAQPPELPSLIVDAEKRPWESAPGGQNTYNGRVAAVAAGFSCGTVDNDFDLTCSVPTVSALGLAQNPFKPVPPTAESGPFDAHVCSRRNVQHLTITSEVSDWLLAELAGPSAHPASRRVGTRKGFDPVKFNPHDPGFLANPYPTYERFREEAPVSVVNPYRAYWAFRYEDVRRLLTEKETFVKTSPLPPVPPPGPIRAMGIFPQGLFNSDPPRHKKLREKLEPLFDAAIGQVPALVSQSADLALGKAAQTGRIELVSDYALPVPSNVLFSILGIPRDPTVRQGLVAWVTAIVAAHDITQTLAVRGGGATCTMALQTFLDALIRQSLKKPQPGLIGEMCKAQVRPDDIQACCFDFIVAGYLSTTFLICTGIRNLLTNADEMEALRKDPRLIKDAVEEMLRIDAPAQIVDRIVKTPTELGGVVLKPGDKVSAVLGSADHDHEVFAQPGRFRIVRDNRDQMSFGYGIHHCIGAPLVRLAAPVALLKLVELDGLEMAGLPQWQADPYLRGLVNLPLAFDA